MDKDKWFLEASYAAHQRLYYESRINDASRIFSWLRKPSKMTIELEEGMKNAVDKLNKYEDVEE